MKALLPLAATAGALLAAAALLLVMAAWQRRRRWLYAAGVALLLGALAAAWVGYWGLRRAHKVLAGALRPRTGEEIYQALLGAAPPGCVQVLEYQDQVVPKIDYAIWLHYRTCPAELKRVLARQAFTREALTTTAGLAPVPCGEEISWFTPQAMGDTVMVYEYATANGRNVQTFWVSPDSTNVYYRDIAD